MSFQFPKRIKGLNSENLNVIYDKPLQTDNYYLMELESIMEYALPKFESIINEGEEIVEEFEMFEDWTDKYQYIIDMGKSLPALSIQDKIEDNLVRGCQSQVWLTAEMKGEIVVFHADSDAIITKGLIAILVRVLSEHTPDEIIYAPLNFMEKIGIKEHLSPTRANGLNAMVTKMKAFALGYKTLKA